MEKKPTKFLRDQHIKYVINSLNDLPDLDIAKTMFLHFLLQTLDILSVPPPFAPPVISSYLYSLQSPSGGFRSGHSLGFKPFVYDNKEEKQAKNSKNYQKNINEIILSEKSEKILFETNETASFFEDKNKLPNVENPHSSAHLVHTYSALLILKSLNDDFSRLDKNNLYIFLKNCQKEDGSFSPEPTSTESDLRFIYAACAIYGILKGERTSLESQISKEAKEIPGNTSAMQTIELNKIENALANINVEGKNDYADEYNFSEGKNLNVSDKKFEKNQCLKAEIDKKKIKEYISRCRTYDGGYGLRPGDECHSGAIYCALASLYLIGEIESVENKGRLVKWLVDRMVGKVGDGEKVGGIQGRINKYPDSCYSFWVGASLKILGFDCFLDTESIEQYIMACQDLKNGGFKKYDFAKNGDPIHTFHSIFGLSILNFPNVKKINPVLGMTIN